MLIRLDGIVSIEKWGSITDRNCSATKVLQVMRRELYYEHLAI
jgi:hypothetical protein